MASIRIEREGRRVYFGGDTFAAKDRIKDLGGKWDAESRRWWVGSTKLAQAEALVASLAGDGAPAPEDLSSARVYARVEYKGRSYYVIAESETSGRCRLTTLEMVAPFWVQMSECKLVKTYTPREVRTGFRGATRTEYQTLGGIAAFVARERKAEKAGEPACPCCGRRGPLIHDLEDGIDKCFSCCDIPADGR